MIIVKRDLVIYECVSEQPEVFNKLMMYLSNCINKFHFFSLFMNCQLEI